MALSENLTLTIIFLFVRGCFWTIFIWSFESPWFCRNSKNFNSNSVKLILEILFSYVLGFVYNFTFIPTGDKPKKLAYCCYYGVSMLENLLVAYLWYYTWKQNELNGYGWFSPMFYSTVTCSVLGIIILILYYMYFHPKIATRFDLVFRKFFRNSTSSTTCCMDRKCTSTL